MRKVFKSNSEVVRVWSRQGQEKGRAGNVFFERDTIYSYGRHFPVARFADFNTVLFTTRGYSNSTTKHKGIISRAIPSRCKIINVHNVCDGFKDVVKENIEYLEYSIKEFIGKAARARKNREWYLDLAERERKNLDNYKNIRAQYVEDQSEQTELAIGI